MKTYDYIIRVSKLGGRVVAAKSTMTVDGQRERAHEAIKGVGGRIGQEHLALTVSGFKVANSRQYRAAVDRIRRREADGGRVLDLQGSASQHHPQGACDDGRVS